MNTRSKKYYQSRKDSDGEKKGSVNKAGYNEETPGSRRKENPAPDKSTDDPGEDKLKSQERDNS